MSAHACIYPACPLEVRHLNSRSRKNPTANPTSRRLEGLDAAIRQGASRRRHQYLRLARSSLPATMAAALVAASIYTTILAMAGRTDWANIALIALGSACIPAIAASLLIVVSRPSYPVTMAMLVTVFASAFVISVLSASRIPLSFVGLAATLPTTLIGVTVANIAIARSLKRSVAVLDFPGAVKLARTIGTHAKILTAHDTDIDVQRVLIDPDAHHTPAWAPVLARLYLRGLAIETWPAYIEGHTGRVDIKSFDLADVSYTHSQVLYYRTKRIFDVLLVIIAALPAALLGGAVWLYIRLLDGAPSVFIQERRGFAGSTFKIYKFRTMLNGNNTGSTAAGDPRIIPGCHTIRRLRIDELPQLINILRGEMSFIGPRPVSVALAESLEDSTPQYVNRQILQPGLTGWAQVSQGYAETEAEEIEKLSYDLYYLKHVSLDLDLIITFRTIRTILLRSGSR